VDEGHHNAAPSWRNVFKHFPHAKVLSLTATPFRSDDEPVLGDVIYRYPLVEAMRRGYVKVMRATNVAPREIYFTYQGEDYHHTLEEVLQLRGRDWFSRGVALAEECNVSIVDASVAWMNHLRQSGGRRSPSDRCRRLFARACPPSVSTL
jgi:superfamily II DNA or RNA helicase